MKVQIETALNNPSVKEIIEFNNLVRVLNRVQSFDELKRFLEDVQFNFFVIGFGSNHTWVKQYGTDMILLENRLLFITL